jgi:hypothetical protein
MVTIVIEILKDSGTDKHEFILLKEKEGLLNYLDELARETVLEHIAAKTYMENYIKEAYYLIYNKLKNVFQKIDNDSNSQFLHINVGGVDKEGELGKDVSQTKLYYITSFVEAFLGLWLFSLCTNGILSKKNVIPRMSIRVKSMVVQKNSHLIKSDLALLSLYGSTDSTFEILEGLDLISHENKELLSNFLDFYRKNSPKRSDFRPSSVYTLREYIFKHGGLNSVEYFDFLVVRDKLIEGTGIDFGDWPFISILSEYGLVCHKGKPRSYESLKHFKQREYDLGQQADAIRKTLKIKYKKQSLASALVGSKLEIGKKYKLRSEIYVSLSEEIEGNLIFSILRNEDKKYLNPEYKDSEFSENFYELASYQRDFLKHISQKRRETSTKVYKQSLKLLNEYLVEFVHPISISNNLHFLDVSGENFTKSKLSPLFSSSEIVLSSFEKQYGITKMPLGFRDWLVLEKDESESSLFSKLSAIEKFFKFVEVTSKALDKNYGSPIPIEFTKSSSKKYSGTTKNIFDVKEWLIFIDILDCLMRIGLKETHLNIEDIDCIFAKEFVKDFDSELLKRKFNFDFNLPEDVVYAAIELYRLQYTEGGNVNAVIFNDTTFWASISCLYIVINTGLRNNSAVNLQLDGLVESKGDKYTSINVIQDKIHSNGFKSMIPTPVLNKVFELRKLLLKHDESFYGVRKVDRGNGIYEEYEGLLGAANKIDESIVSTVADFVFYLYNEIVKYWNSSLGYQILQEIKIRPFTNFQTRGVGVERKTVIPVNAYALSSSNISNKNFQDISSELCPLVLIRFKPDITVHSLRATFVTTAHLAGVSSEIIKACTGQEPVTQSHYIKATAMNMEYLASGARFDLIEKILRNEPGIRPAQLSDDEVAESARSGIIRSGGLSCSLKGILNTDDIESIYRTNFKNVSIHSTHICPHNDDCPTYILNELNNEKNCAVCPVSISFISDIPAISQKIRFHIDEAQALKNGNNSNKRGRKTNETEWVTHFKEASNWLARYDLLMDSKGIIAGENTIRDSKNALAMFTCEDNGLLDDILRMIESRGYNCYQSSSLKAKAMMLQMRLAPILDNLNTELLISDPVESVCRTLDKILKVNKIGIEEVLSRLSSDSQLLVSKDVINAMLIGGKNE